MKIVLIFNMSTSYFHKISFRYSKDCLMTKLTLGQGSQAEESGNTWVWSCGHCKPVSYGVQWWKEEEKQVVISGTQTHISRYNAQTTALSMHHNF
jgi:hypothetical protein